MGGTLENRREFTGGLVVISGPSGSGKTTIGNRIRAHKLVTKSVSATTRPMRPGETHGKDYFFMTEEEFRAGIRAGNFVEYNDVFASGILYGSLKSEVEKGLADTSRYTVLEIDVQGALNLKTLDFQGRYVFIQPPSMDELRHRLEARDTEGNDEIEQRLAKAAWEMRQAWQYDKIVVNDDLERAIGETEEWLGLNG
jgi:guanylate kinase